MGPPWYTAVAAPASALYGAAATWRRRWYAHPSRRRRLTQPVISVGNLRVGGSGKTPIVSHIAELLIASGERPSILSRGYARERNVDGVTVVSDGSAVRSDLAHSGDEPLLLARALAGVPVLVCAERALAGRLAEERFNVTVHLLDDGFQHLQLARDIDLLLVDPGDLEDRVLPAGRLREPIANASDADAVLVAGVEPSIAADIAARLRVGQAWSVHRRLGAPYHIRATPPAPPPSRDVRVFAVAGIARPERFFDDLTADGWSVAGILSFRDHWRYEQVDVRQIVEEAERAGAELILTTEKDAVRLEALDLSAFRFAAVPLHAAIEPAETFAAWLKARLEDARARRNATHAPVTRRPTIAQ